MSDGRESVALERAGGQTALAERMTVNQVEEAFKEYRELQKRLDVLMPDQIKKIGKEQYRMKGYWRAVKKWARLTVEIVKEDRIETGDDWGFLMVVRATAPDGTSEEGDGSCMASEKAVYKKDWAEWERNGKKGRPAYKRDKDGLLIIDPVETAKNATVHNVRAHALTRAKNRAISDLVGFGEVSAEEINGQPDAGPSRDDRQKDTQRRVNKNAKDWAWTNPLWERAKAAGMPSDVWSKIGHSIEGLKSADKATNDQRTEFAAKVYQWINENQKRDPLPPGEAPPPDTIPEETGELASKEALTILRETSQRVRLAVDDDELLIVLRGLVQNQDLQSLEDLTETECQKALDHIDRMMGDKARQHEIGDQS